MSIEAEIERQMRVAKWIDKNLSIPYDLTRECELLSHPCFDSVIENHAAMITLASSKLYGSMFALLRVSFEGTIRGTWLYHCASELDLEQYKNDKLDTHLGDMVKMIESGVNIDTGMLSQIKKDQWRIFSSFIHTGYQSTIRRVGENSTGYDNYEAQEIQKALNYSGLFTIIAAIGLSTLAKCEVLQMQVLEFSRKYIEKKL